MNQRDNVNQGEVRRAPRKSVSRAVVVAYGEKRATVGETFVNISSSGARIRTLARQELLDGFLHDRGCRRGLSAPPSTTA